MKWLSWLILGYAQCVATALHGCHPLIYLFREFISSWRHKSTEAFKCHSTWRHGELGFLSSRHNINIMPIWIYILSYHVDLSALISRHGNINYLTNSTWWHKLHCQVVMAEVLFLPSRLYKNYMSSWLHKLSYQVDFRNITCRHGDLNYLTMSTSEILHVALAT